MSNDNCTLIVLKVLISYREFWRCNCNQRPVDTMNDGNIIEGLLTLPIDRTKQ